MTPSTLIATLGGQSQIVTFALDILLARGERVTDVCLLHPAATQPRIQRALAQLGKEFENQHYAGQPCRLQRVPLQVQRRAIAEIHNEMEADATWQIVRELIVRQKATGNKLHLLVAGGRRMMGLLVASAAALLCDHQDTIWHIYTPDTVQARVRDGALMHVTPADGVNLIRVPLVPWGAYFPGLRAMAMAPQDAVAAQMGWLRAAHDQQCQQVYERLSERQRRALIAFAQGQSPQDVAETLDITLSTVNTYKTAILAECRIAWQLPEAERLTYHFLAERFGPFLRHLDEA